MKTIVRISPHAVDSPEGIVAEKLPALAVRMLAEAYSQRRSELGDDALMIVDHGKDGKPVYLMIGSRPPELVIGNRKVWGVFSPPDSQEPVATFFDKVDAEAWASAQRHAGREAITNEIDATDRSSVHVAVAVLFMRGGKILLGKLKRAGQYVLPEGPLEVGESIEAAAQRAMKKMTGLTVGKISVSKHAPYVSTFIDNVGQHFLTLIMIAEDVGGEPLPVNELWESCGWFDASKPPEPLFITVRQIIALAKFNVASVEIAPPPTVRPPLPNLTKAWDAGKKKKPKKPQPRVSSTGRRAR